MGLRLPLDSLPWVSDSDYPYLVEQDPSTDSGALPTHANLAARYTVGEHRRHDSPGEAATHSGGADAPRTLPDLAGHAAPGEATRKMQSNAGSAHGDAARDSSAANARRNSNPSPPTCARAAARESAHWITRTALCVEVRDPRRANGPKGGGSRPKIRRTVCLHATAGDAGGLPRFARRHRGDCHRAQGQDRAGGLPTTA